MSINFKISDLRKFDKIYDTTQEDRAAAERGFFIDAFPISRLKKLTVDDYIVGKGGATFCNYVEALTKTWANIQGSTAFKFGIYYGKTSSDPVIKYRFTKKFGNRKKEAFDSVKLELLDLVDAGKVKDYKRIDSNSLSQMIKAKILSLYFDTEYINICSADKIEEISEGLGLPIDDYLSAQQNKLMEIKQRDSVTKNWSNPKYMSFLFSKYIYGDLDSKPTRAIIKPRKKSKRKVNFDDINDARKIIGRRSEKFAIKWEKSRLIGLGWSDIAKKVEDRSDRPGYGYDVLSYSNKTTERYIEVKSAKKTTDGMHRFFLSENELAVSKSREHNKEYYFYLVTYDKNKKPVDLLAIKANDVYENSKLLPCAYKVMFDF